MNKPHAQPGEKCPFWKKDVSKVCHTCPMYQQLRGTDNNTGQPVDFWGCSLAMIPTLLVENSVMQRQTGAAVESFRNEMVKSNDTMSRITAAATRKMIEG